MRINVLICAAMLLLAGCLKTDIPAPIKAEKEMISFTVFYGKDSCKFTINDSTIEGVKPDTLGKENLVAAFTFKGTKVTMSGIEQVSGLTENDFRKPLMYTVTAADGSVKNYKVILKSFTGLPIIYINSPSITSREDYVNGTMTIYGNTDYEPAGYKIQIKGRGNSTWGHPKNPYKIKLSDKAGLLGMPADKEWALLANYFDKSLLRNDVGFELSGFMNMAWTPRRRFVEVFLNGAYNGNYLLTETVKTGKDRLNIDVMNDKDPADTLNGYLMEADWQQQATQTFVTPDIVKFSMKDPEVVTAPQLNYITKQMFNIELQVLDSVTDLSSFIDIDSWIKWTIINEVMRNRDATLYGSSFFYQGAHQKIFMGPVWDFDLSSGGYTDNTATGWYATTSKIVGFAFIYNQPYKSRFKAIWKTYKDKIASLPAYIDSQRKKLQLSQVQNYNKWPLMSTPVFEGQVVFQTYDQEVQNLRNFLTERISWIDKELNK